MMLFVSIYYCLSCVIFIIVLYGSDFQKADTLWISENVKKTHFNKSGNVPTYTEVQANTV